MRGLVGDWPAVQAAHASDEAIAAYLAGCAPQRPVMAIAAAPEEGGRFFYNRDLTGFNFRQARGRLDLLLVDEVHQYKGIDSDQGYAMHHLAQVADKLVALTGTIYGGKASSLFYLLFRLAPVRQAFRHGQARVARLPVVPRAEPGLRRRTGECPGHGRPSREEARGRATSRRPRRSPLPALPTRRSRRSGDLW